MRLFSFNLEVICTRVFFKKFKLHEKLREGDKNFSVDDFFSFSPICLHVLLLLFFFFCNFFSIFFSTWKL